MNGDITVIFEDGIEIVISLVNGEVEKATRK